MNITADWKRERGEILFGEEECMRCVQRDAAYNTYICTSTAQHSTAHPLCVPIIQTNTTTHSANDPTSTVPLMPSGWMDNVHTYMCEKANGQWRSGRHIEITLNNFFFLLVHLFSDKLTVRATYWWMDIKQCAFRCMKYVKDMTMTGNRISYISCAWDWETVGAAKRFLGTQRRKRHYIEVNARDTHQRCVMDGCTGSRSLITGHFISCFGYRSPRCWRDSAGRLRSTCFIKSNIVSKNINQMCTMRFE